MRRRLAWLLGLCGAALLVWVPAAAAKYLGSDVLGNIGPESNPGPGTLVDRYPLSAYGLDSHVDVGVTDLDGVAPTIAHWAAAQLWSVTSFLVRTVIDLFTWAFSLDLLGGDPGRPDDGALAPVAEAVASLYENVLGEAWMIAAIIAAGIWGIWKALVQRRYTETAAGLAVSVAFVVIALFFVYQPERTVGEASRWTNTLSLAFLSGANRGTVDDPQQAKREVADRLFEAQVYRPWVVLNFGGLRHCVDTTQVNDDGYPRPVAPHDPKANVCRDHRKPGSDGHGGYAPRFLRFAPGSDERDAEYEVLRKGEVKPDDPQFKGYRVDKSDSPAVDIQQAGGAYQRLTVAVLVFAGSLGAVILLGFLSLAVILAQVVALVLLAFAPVALVVGIFPSRGHEFFRTWLAKLATAVFIKALYSLVIAVVVAVSAALTSSTESLGFLFSFALQAIFFWAIFLYRRQITARLVAATTGENVAGRLPGVSARTVRRGADIAAHPFSALASGTRRAVDRVQDKRQQSALAGEETLAPGSESPRAEPGAVPSPHAGESGAPSPAVNGHHDRSANLAGGPAQGDDANGAASAVHHADPGRASEADRADRTAASNGGHRERDLTPAQAHADVMQRARELRAAQHAGARTPEEQRS